MPERNLWRKRQIILDPELVQKLYEWHGGQFTPVYGLASTGHEDLVSASMIDAGISDLERTLRSLKGIRERRELEDLIGELELRRSSWREFSAQESGMDMSEDEYEYDRQDYGTEPEDEAESSQKMLAHGARSSRVNRGRRGAGESFEDKKRRTGYRTLEERERGFREESEQRRKRRGPGSKGERIRGEGWEKPWRHGAGKKHDINDTVVDRWSERDRYFIGLKDKRTDEFLLELWDDDALQAVEDGFIDTRSPRKLHESLWNYYQEQFVHTGAGSKRGKPGKKHGAGGKKLKKGRARWATYQQRLDAWKAKPYTLVIKYDQAKYRGIYGARLAQVVEKFATRKQAQTEAKRLKALKLPTLKVKVAKLPKPKKPKPPKSTKATKTKTTKKPKKTAKKTRRKMSPAARKQMLKNLAKGRKKRAANLMKQKRGSKAARSKKRGKRGKK